MDNNQLNNVMQRFSKILEELSYACSDVQTIAQLGVSSGSQEAVVKMQAMDRVIQTLTCLSDFSAAVSELSELKYVTVSDEALNAIGLPSVRQSLDTNLADEPSHQGEVTLF